MSWTYTFFSPVRLPLTPDVLSEETVRSFTDPTAVQTALGAHLPSLAWGSEPGDISLRASVTVDGALHEFSIMPHEPPELIVSLRCSGRVDSTPFVQGLCDALGWIAFDDRVHLFQPHRSPVPGGGG